MRKPTYRIAHVASEAAPFAKTGGLGDVVGALPEALAGRGCTVSVIIPRYPETRKRAQRPRKHARVPHATVDIGQSREEVSFCATKQGAVEVVLVDHARSFDREGLYVGPDGCDYPDNAERFALFSRAAFAFLRALPVPPDVVHCHDWQTGPLVHFVAHEWPSPRPAVVYTVHNAAYTGVFPAEAADLLGADSRAMAPDGPLEFWGSVSYLKAGLRAADLSTTVSPTYAREVASCDEYGRGLHGVYARLGERFVGVLNGIDPRAWNPATDALIPANYSASDLSGKTACKRALMETLGLPEERVERPLIGTIGRLVEQKGVGVLIEAMPDLVGRDLSVAVLGAGDKHYAQALEEAAQLWPDRVAVRLGYVDERLAHLIEAGSDVFLMPSKFEPCGLNQMYSLAYGTVPVVRSTGGLRDTVSDADIDPERGNGFAFEEFSSSALVSAVDRALAWYSEPARWRALVLRGMAEDHSWDTVAATYCGLYGRAVALAGA